MAARRRRGEDGISFQYRGPCRDPERHRLCQRLWRGEITPEHTEDGKRVRRKVSGKTRVAVVDKLSELHPDLRQGIVPKTGHENYTVRQAAEDGLAGRSAKMVKKNQNVLEPILKVVVGARKLRELSAANVAGGTVHDGRRVFQFGCDHGPPRAEARHPACGGKRPGGP